MLHKEMPGYDKQLGVRFTHNTLIPAFIQELPWGWACHRNSLKGAEQDQHSPTGAQG